MASGHWAAHFGRRLTRAQPTSRCKRDIGASCGKGRAMPGPFTSGPGGPMCPGLLPRQAFRRSPSIKIGADAGVSRSRAAGDGRR